MSNYQLTADETVTVLERREDALVVEVTYGPGGSPPPAHHHPAQDERFELLEGSVRVRVAGRESTLGAGGSLEISRGTVHQMWNPGDEPARLRWTTSPAGRTEEWFLTVDRLTGPGGKRDVLGVAAAAGAFADTFVLDGPLRTVLAVLRPVARVMGRRVT